MKIFIWKNVDGLTDRCHDNGGLAVIAESVDRARALFLEKNPDQVHCLCLTQEPDFEAEILTSLEQCFVFQDAGCC